MELRQYGRTIWKWLWLILLGTIVAGGATYLVSSRSTPIYRASTQLLVQQGSTPAGQQWLDVLTSERLAANYARLLTTRPVLEQTAATLGVSEITSRIVVDPVRETQIIELHSEDPNPAMAAAVANALPMVFIERTDAIKEERFSTSLDIFDQQINEVTAAIGGAEEELDRIDNKEILEGLAEDDEQRRAQLEVSLAQLRSSLVDLQRKQDELRREIALSGDNILVVEEAEVPTSAVRPRVMVNTLVALAMGFLLMVALAFLIEYLDDTIKLPEDAARVTGLPALGSLVQHRGNGQRELITVANPKSPFAEGYRTLRTNIQFSSLDRPIEMLMITSASPGEGKSTSVANLAVAMAQSGKRTVLVDTDLRRPVLHQIFGLPNSVGVTTAVLQPPGGDLSPLLQPTGVDNLSLLTSGPQPPNPSELLGSKRMAELVAELKHHADVLLFDSPPVLAVTDAAVMARLMDGVLLVVESAKTREDAARRAAQELSKVNANVLGVAVNRISYRLAGSHYYYYDYYEEKGAGPDDSQGKGRRALSRARGKGNALEPQPEQAEYAERPGIAASARSSPASGPVPTGEPVPTGGELGRG